MRPWPQSGYSGLWIQPETQASSSNTNSLVTEWLHEIRLTDTEMQFAATGQTNSNNSDYQEKVIKAFLFLNSKTEINKTNTVQMKINGKKAASSVKASML